MRTLLAIARLIVFAIGTVFVTIYMVSSKKLTGSIRSTKWFHRWICTAFNIKVRHVGTPLDRGPIPTLFLINHLSYLDIAVIGARLNGIFVSKSEVEHWPVFGFLAKIQDTIFIRRKRTAMEESKEAVTAVLRNGENIFLFGEGTSSDGSTVLPFKPGLLEPLFEPGLDVRLQPTAIVVEKIDGKKPENQRLRDVYAWYRPESELEPHIWTFAHTTRTEIAVHYLPPLNPADFPDRKTLAEAAHAAILRVVEGAGGKGYTRISDVPVAQLDRAPVS